MLKMILLAGSGSFIGGILRYLMQLFFSKFFLSSFPVGTLIVNIIGSFLIGVIFSLSDKSDIISQEAKIFLAVGICGGFTTFSSFSIENFFLLRDGQYFQMVFYTMLSVFLGLSATFAGFQLIKII
jgi:CrcB protein